MTRVIGSEATAILSLTGLSIVGADGAQTTPELPAELREALRGNGPPPAAPREKLPAMGDSAYVQTHSSDHGFAEQVALCAAFAEKIRDRSYRNPAIADFGDGVAHMEVIDAVEQSMAQRRWIDLG